MNEEFVSWMENAKHVLPRSWSIEDCKKLFEEKIMQEECKHEWFDSSFVEVTCRNCGRVYR